jgi:hypothetical protein
MNSFFNPADKLSERRAEMETVEIFDKMSRKVHFLCVDFLEKDLAKKHKCKFDRDLKLWYCEDKSNPMIETHSRVDLYFEFKDKDEYKALGAKYCPINKVWYGKSGNTELMAHYKKFKDSQRKKWDEELEHYRKNKTYH